MQEGVECTAVCRSQQGRASGVCRERRSKAAATRKQTSLESDVCSLRGPDTIMGDYLAGAYRGLGLAREAPGTPKSVSTVNFRSKKLYICRVGLKVQLSTSAGPHGIPPPPPWLRFRRLASCDDTVCAVTHTTRCHWLADPSTLYDSESYAPELSESYWVKGSASKWVGMATGRGRRCLTPDA